MSEKNLSDIGEWGLLDRLKKFYPLDDKRVALGFGDDTAVIDPAPDASDYVLLTLDTLVEGTHFLVNDFDPYKLGRKSLAVNLSDIAAMGGIPEFYLVSLAAPKHMAIAIVEDIYRGLVDEGETYKVALVNGDTVRSERLVITVMLVGKKPKSEPLPLRSAAKPGHHVYVTGTVGDSAAGLKILQSKINYGAGAVETYLVHRHLMPVARISEGRAIVTHLTDPAMIDISDGVHNELGLIKRFSTVGIKVFVQNLPISNELEQYCREQGKQAMDYALFGGEDYELLFTTSADPVEVSNLFRRHCPETRVSQIGLVTTSNELLFVDAKENRIDVTDTTFRHF